MDTKILPDHHGLNSSPIPHARKQSDDFEATVKQRKNSAMTSTNARAVSGRTNRHATEGAQDTPAPRPVIEIVKQPENHSNPQWGRYNSVTWAGVIGTGSIVLFCPIMVIAWQIVLNNFEGSFMRAAFGLVDMGVVAFVARYFPRPTQQALLGYAAWVVFQIFLYKFLPARTAYGQRTPAGHLLPYKVNGTFAWVVCHVAYVVAVCLGVLDPAIIAKNFDGLVIAFNVYGYFLPAMAYLKAHWAPTHPDDCKFSGSIMYDYYMGIELNPRIGDWFDFKLFHNGRPGIVAWTLINLSFTAWQYQLHGFVTNSIIIVNILHAMYVVDFFINEDWYLRTIDICHDHYGFYLAWGSMVWLPTMYTLQCQYLARYPYELSNTAACIILGIGIAGYIIFRSVNHQKDIARRTNGNCTIWGKKAEIISARYSTEDGKQHQTILLCSGWWGILRHANYMGDLIISYAGCAAAGWAAPEWVMLPWTYAIFMTILLVQRCMRDESRCSGKYGKTWDDYCNKVPWKLIPYVW